MYNHVGGDTVTLVDGERLSMDATDTTKLRLGTRYSRMENDRVGYYLGAAYEYEFGGEANGSIVGVGNIDSPSIRGGTGIVEVGTKCYLSESKNAVLNLGLEGHFGKRKGVQGSVNLNFFF